MSGLRLCHAGGLLVHGAARLPEDPSEYCHAAVHAACGCNRMRCNSCGAMVRSQPNRGVLAGVAPQALYEAADWDGLSEPSSAVGSFKPFRLYTCRCVSWECGSAGVAIDREGESLNDPHMDWACVGHPVPELPRVLNGVVIDLSTDWPDVVERVLRGWAPVALGVGSREGPALWLGWLYAWLLGSPAADALSRALAARAEDDDPLVRGRVRSFFSRFGAAPGIDRLIDGAIANPASALKTYKIPEYMVGPSAFDAVVARLEAKQTDEVSVRAGHAFRSALVASPDVPPPAVDVVKEALERFSSALDDAEVHQYLADNITAIEAARAGRWRAVMDVLAGWFNPNELGHLIVIGGMSLLERGVVPPTELRDWIDAARRNHRWVNDAWVLPLRSVTEPPVPEKKKKRAS